MRDQINTEAACFTGLNDGLYTGCSSGIVDAANTKRVRQKRLQSDARAQGSLSSAVASGDTLPKESILLTVCAPSAIFKSCYTVSVPTARSATSYRRLMCALKCVD